MRTENLCSLLPWRHPFLMVDGVLDCVPHDRVVTMKRVTAGDPVAQPRETGNASFPSVMVLEGLSQSAALLFQVSYAKLAPGRVPLLGQLDASIFDAARPGDTIEFTVHAVKMTQTAGIFRGVARVDGASIAEAELAFAVGAL